MYEKPSKSKIIKNLKDEFSMFGNGVLIIFGVILFLGLIILFIVVFSYIWGYYTSPQFRKENPELQAAICVILPMILASICLNVLNRIKKRLKNEV